MVESNNLEKASQLPSLNGLKLSSSSENVAIKIATKEPTYDDEGPPKQYQDFKILDLNAFKNEMRKMTTIFNCQKTYKVTTH